MRVFVNDCGVTCPLGNDCAQVADGLVAGRRAFVERTDILQDRVVPVGAVPSVSAEDFALESRNDRLMEVALEQIEPSIRMAAARFGRDRVAVVLGSSTSGMAKGEFGLASFRQDGVWPAGFHYRQQEPGALAQFAARELGLAGLAYTVATACSSSAKVFASARRLMRAGLADAVVAGGADSLCKMTLNGFASLEALSRSVCAPFSRNRDGITIGEGAAAFLLTAEPGPVELLGVGETSDAHHVTAPDPDGAGAREAMVRALADAGLQPDDIAYLNLHGTGTPLNDAMESKAVASLFPSSLQCSSTKGMTGHMLGATGGVEAAFLWILLNRGTTPGRLPPHLWDGVSDPELPTLSLVSGDVGIPESGRVAMLSNSFGFGGSNVSLVMGRC